jgi:hypothetical protein
VSLDAETLYGLLPAIYRVRDAEIAAALERPAAAGPLRTLLAVLAGPLEALEANLDQLYADQFIETCADWVVPYIGDLIGYRPLYPVGPRAGRARAEVAHTIAFRRRKGTAAMLEQLARDATGWNARAVEFFQLIATTQYMNHRRDGHVYAPSLRAWEPLERIGTAFDSIPHTVDVRRIGAREEPGRYNIPNVGIFLWRLDAHSLTLSPAVSVGDRRLVANPLGIDTPLVTRPEPEDEISHLAEPLNVPAPISCRVLAARKLFYYGATNRSIGLRVDDVDIPPAQITASSLSDDGASWSHMPPAGQYAIDPARGRIALPPDVRADARVLVTIHYAFGAELGGGEYARGATFDLDAGSEPVVRVPDDVPRIQQALDLLGGRGIVEITDSGRYEEALSVVVAPDAHLELRAADHRRPTIVLSGDMLISGGGSAQVSLNGLLVAGGRVRVMPDTNAISVLAIKHCTLVPGLGLSRAGTPVSGSEASLVVALADVKVRLERTIVGAIALADRARAEIADSIVDATDQNNFACQAPGGGASGPLVVRASTIVGRVHTRELELASNSIFTSTIVSEHRQSGCVRFSYLPLDSRVGQRHRCQPSNATPHPVLQFETLHYGVASYGQLGRRTDAAIARGADDESEMGAYHHLYRTQRETNLRIRLDEYLRAGLECGIFLES